MTEPPSGAPTVPGLTGLTVFARGGYATVFRAVQVSVGRHVAVKVENRTLENERDQRRFLREAWAAGRMSSHPHVVDLFDAGVTGEGHPYLIMDLCTGSYAERIKTNPLSVVEARDVGVKIGDALANAHGLGVLHRDVKPANILLTRFGEPVLADFGLAILSEFRDQSITMDVLTPAYAPPEAFRYSPPSPAGDVYALCATLYAMLHGKPPRWQGDQTPSLVSLIDMFAEPIPALPGVPPELMGLLQAGMANDHAARPTAVQLRDALTALPIDIGGWHQVLPSPSGVIPAGAIPARAVPAGAIAVGAKPAGAGGVPGVGGRGRRWSAVVAAALVLAVLGGFIWYTLRHPLVHVGGSSAHSSTSIAPSESPAQPAPAPVAGASCLFAQLLSGVRCVTAAECYDALVVAAGMASAPPVACTAAHTWEVFALFDLPGDFPRVDYEAVKNNAAVRDACSAATLSWLAFEVRTWPTDVLPPAQAAFVGGDRTVRCLAGPGAGVKSTGSRFAP